MTGGDTGRVVGTVFGVVVGAAVEGVCGWTLGCGPPEVPGVGAVEGAVDEEEEEEDDVLPGAVVDGAPTSAVESETVVAELGCGRPNQPASTPVATTATPPSEMVSRRTRVSPRSRSSGDCMAPVLLANARRTRVQGKGWVRERRDGLPQPCLPQATASGAAEFDHPGTSGAGDHTRAARPLARCTLMAMAAATASAPPMITTRCRARVTAV